MPRYNFKRLWPTNTSISWWYEGRSLLNVVIERYNQWQLDGFNPGEVTPLIALIEYARAQLEPHRDGGSEWFREMDEMEAFVREAAGRPACPHCGF